MKLIRFFLIAIITVNLFANAIKDKDGQSISVDKLIFDGENFIVDGDKIDRSEITNVYFSQHEQTKREIPEELKLTKEKIAQYNKIASEMEKNYPDANGLTLRFYEKMNLTSDGRDVSFVHSVRKVLSQDAIDWANQSFYFVEGENRVNILVARSISPDGTVTDFTESDIRKVKSAREGNFFGKGENISLTVPNVGIGSIIEVAYINEYYAPEDPNLFTFRYSFQGSEPSKFDRLDVEVPKDRDVYYISQFLDDYFKTNYVTNVPNANIPESEVENPTYAEVFETDSSKIYRWTMEDIEPLVKEPDMPAERDVIPRVVGGLYPDFSYYNERYSRIYEEHMQATPVLDSVAWSVVGDSKSEKEKIAKLYHWVQRNIRYISIKGTLASSKGGHFAQITFDNKYGDCTDKAVLFATLLRIVGIEAYTISLLTNRKGFVDRGMFPSLETNHCINEVWWDDEPHVLDATGSNMRFPYYSNGDTDIWYSNYIRGEAVYNPPVLPEDNALLHEKHITLDEFGNAVISDSISFTGNYEGWYRGYFERTPVDEHRNYIEKIVNRAYPGASVKDFNVVNVSDISKPFWYTYNAEAPEILTSAGEFYLLDPNVNYSFPGIDLNERKYGIKLSYPKRSAHSISFDLPEDMEIEFLPESIEVVNPYFEYKASYVQNGNSIQFEDDFRLKRTRIPAKDYQIYKQDAEKVLTYLKKRVFLNPANDIQKSVH